MTPERYAAALARGTDRLRGYVEARQESLSRCTVRRKTGNTVKVAGFDRDEWVVVHENLPLRRTDAGRRAVEIAGVTYSDATGRDDFPHDTPLEDDDYIEVTSGEWVGVVERVIKAVKSDQRTARRVPVQEVARPKEWD